MDTPRQSKPIYLLADSQLLFWKPDGKPLLAAVRESLPDVEPAAAYIGASNGDRPEFYTIFEAAMDMAGFTNRRMIRSEFNAEDRDFLTRAQLIVLSGGDVRQGWTTFEQTGMREIIHARHTAGAVLVGISAGAVQLARYGVLDRGEAVSLELIDMLNLVPALIDVHDEKQDWTRLTNAVRMLEGTVTGVGIPSGGGMVFYPDGTADALRHPVSEFTWDGTKVVRGLLVADRAAPES